MNSLTQSLLGKPIDEMRDEDELKLYEKLKAIFQEFDNLCEISTKEIGNKEEEVIKIEITSRSDGLQKQVINLPKKKNQKIDELVKKIVVNLSKDSKLNIITLSKLLRQELKNE